MLICENGKKENNHEERPEKVNAELFRLLLQFKDYGVIMISPFGTVMTCNTGAEHIYGYSAEELIGKHMSVFNKDVELDINQEYYLKTTNENERFEYEGWKYRKDGTTFYANTILTTVYTEDATLQGFVVVTRDITIQKKLAEENALLKDELEEKVKQRTKELEIVNKELEAFSYSVSHDLRTPLRAVSGYSIMLKEDYELKLDEEGNRIINNIIDHTKMMGQLIDDLLTFSRMARLEAIYGSINMKKLAMDCFNELLQNEKEHKYSIKVNELPTCKGDMSMLKQVWYNLISNAIKYSSKRETPQIEVGAIDDERNNIYYVKDNGAGFDMKYSKKLFGVFQRLHRQDEFEGTGLGLALAQRIVSKHSGEIWEKHRRIAEPHFISVFQKS